MIIAVHRTLGSSSWRKATERDTARHEVKLPTCERTVSQLGPRYGHGFEQLVIWVSSVVVPGAFCVFCK